MWQWAKARERIAQWLGGLPAVRAGRARAARSSSPGRGPAATGSLMAALFGALLLSGCASTITTDVTAFREPGWQNDPPRTFAFDPSAQQQGQLDRQTYENWVADALAQHGFSQVPRQQARYLVTLDYDTDARLVRVQETYYPDPWFPGPYWGPYWGLYWGRYGYGPWGPAYWPPQTVVRDVPATLSSLKIYLREAKGDKRVYQVTAQNLSEGASLPGVMPYLVRGAFTEFPMESGRPRRITLDVEKPAK